MKYRIRHRTTYAYKLTASVSHNVLYLCPRNTDYQKIARHRTVIQPGPTMRAKRTDVFGNTYEIIAVETPHRNLKIASDSMVTVFPRSFIAPETTPPWESVRDAVRTADSEAALIASEFAFESPQVPFSAPVAEYAREIFFPGRPVLAGAMDLMAHIYRDFKYDARATTVSTPVAAVFASRRGVCQDFAHLMLAAVRSIGLAARYVSGYLETLPPPGKARLVGADASHAWVSIWVPNSGWVDLDPTNNVLPSERHITVAWGRDYQDVTPVRGVVLGGGPHKLSVSVDVAPVTD